MIFSNQHLVLIDDNQALREAMSIMLKLNHFNVTESDHLQEVFDNNQLPDLYIVDYWLNDMLGTSLCSIIKSNEISKKIPVIIMSGDPFVEPAVYNVGADAFLLKPFSMRQMLLLINYMLNPLSDSNRISCKI